ncbi:MAG: SDR family oxidoreductase [Alphaproteobacteria bacterium]
MSQSVEGRVAIVTGASSGVGRAMARLFAAQGARVVLAARTADRLDALAAELAGDHLVVPTDLARPDNVEALVARARDHFGRVDILIANAGQFTTGPAVEGDPAVWDEVLAVNVNSVFRLVRATLPGMIAARSGDIIVTSSIAGHAMMPQEPVYSASKHAIQAFVHSVRSQVARHNVRVGAIAPGTILNELWGITEQAEIDRRVADHSGLRSEDVAEACLFMLTRPANVTIRDLVILPQGQEI